MIDEERERGPFDMKSPPYTNRSPGSPPPPPLTLYPLVSPLFFASTHNETPLSWKFSQPKKKKKKEKQKRERKKRKQRRGI